MKFENTNVMNFEGAFRGLRNPLESWEKSDSYIEEDGHWKNKKTFISNLQFYLGQKDLDLAQRMIKAGDSDSKFLRQIFVSVDITAPLYWWKEADTYKIGTTANSTSTMHKIASTPITIDCFEMNDYNGNYAIPENGINLPTPHSFINYLEYLRQKYNETKDEQYWKELIRWLPEGWLQTRTWTANYSVLRNMYFQRQHHRLSEWHQFCSWVETLPYTQELILYKGED